MNQTTFTNNSSIYLKQKRLRHLNTLSVKNLKLTSNRFTVWFTLHSTKQNRAFYISDKKENDRNPKWTLLNLPKSSLKQFYLRIWFSSQDTRLGLLLEINVNMDFLFCLSESNLNYSIKNLSNFLVFELFGINFSEPLNNLVLKEQNKIQINSANLINNKNSYNLNLLTRLHDFQRVIYETQKKIAQLKTNSSAKFDASSKLRQLQLKREQKLQTLNLYKEDLQKKNQSLCQLNEFNSKLKESSLIYKKNIEIIKWKLSLEKEKLSKVESFLELNLKSFVLLENEVKYRQKRLINNLESVFPIKDYKILNAGIVLSNEQETCVALGYLAQCVLVLANILCVPLR